MKATFRVGFAIGVGIAGAAHASETVTYSYDVQGRVTGASTSGGPATGIAAAYHYDKAHNRSNVTVTGAATSGSLMAGDGVPVAQAGQNEPVGAISEGADEAPVAMPLPEEPQADPGDTTSDPGDAADPG